MTCEELDRRMSATELMEWVAYDQETTSESWHQAAMICCVIANTTPGVKKRFKPDDFLPMRSKRQQTSEEMREVFRGLQARMGGGETVGERVG